MKWDHRSFLWRSPSARSNAIIAALCSQRPVNPYEQALSARDPSSNGVVFYHLIPVSSLAHLFPF